MLNKQKIASALKPAPDSVEDLNILTDASTLKVKKKQGHEIKCDNKAKLIFLKDPN